MQSEEIIHDLPKGLLQWYQFKKNSSILYIGNKTDSVIQILAGHSDHLVTASCDRTLDMVCESVPIKNFDYIISIQNLETVQHPEHYLRSWKKLLKPDGRLLLGMNNRFGIRYFCGDKDPYTNHVFDGIEAYRQAYFEKGDIFQGRCYNQEELKHLLHNSGWPFMHFFSVLPDLDHPYLIYSEKYLPNEDLTNRIFPTYHCPDSVFLEEEKLYADLAYNGLFHKMANAYLIECPLNGRFSDIIHVTNTLERGREHAFFTVIHSSGTVEKKAAYPQGQPQLEALVQNTQNLSKHGVSVIDVKMENGVCTMPYMNGESGQIYLRKLLLNNPDQFLLAMDQFRGQILKSSDIQKKDTGDGQGAVLCKGYLDMVPLNSFYVNENFVFYDQEFCMDNCPANLIILRMISTFYAGNMELQGIMPINKLYDRYGLSANLDHWKKMEQTFLSDLRKAKELRVFNEKYRRNSGVINSNRQRINYTPEEYQYLFIDIFHDEDSNQLILFGSGSYARRFLAYYKKDHPVYAIVDNNKDKWGQELDGITIHPPQYLEQINGIKYKVLICMKNYMSVMKQLDRMGIARYSIFDPQKSYPRKKLPAIQEKNTAPKKYGTGYIAGVFDLFHIGHLNMFKRAKEQCSRLIVGVLTDEGVYRYKHVKPFIPFSERIELVRSCKYVDEAVEIPLNYSSTRDAYVMHHFDCQFSGSDYINDPNWLADKEFLKKHGAEMVFFPYTESTSSTKIKSLIEKQLLH